MNKEYKKNIDSSPKIKKVIKRKSLNDEDNTKTNSIILYLIDLIKSKKVPVNKIMPSEHALMERFNCSRSVVVSAYQKLSALGAVYSISKRGHFVAENFHNLIKPVSFLLNVDKQWGEEIHDFIEPEWFGERNIIFVDGTRMFRKFFYKKGEVIAEADIWVSTKNLDKYEPIDLSVPLIDVLSEREPIKNIVYDIHYEKEANRLGHENMMVLMIFGYDEDSICIAAKYYIKPEHFKFYHQEFSLL
ncbi:GntR family transcriptional regulator [Mycoplasmopsis edwardii]|uniref:Winged helix-turn-helix domain-containing protein n=3 Tax=Mycoplasmopsis edwardii TaxID=53558 RepID=A0ACD4PHF0_9BACT|nr:winged helix-turn-helix domain-containing protein [Mycoplasmopsis edwardii]WBP84082.1 winged helix-turn-helix domain-containing protein [Mycoplasmopsis edwardii]